MSIRPQCEQRQQHHQQHHTAPASAAAVAVTTAIIYLRAHAAARSCGTTSAQWLERAEPLWSIVLPPSKVRKVLAETSDWSTVEPELIAITSTGPLGQRLFGFAMRVIIVKAVHRIFDRNFAPCWPCPSSTPLLSEMQKCVCS